LDLYDRQKELELDIPESVGVIGIGGVGSWVALNMALVGVKKMVLVDHDTIEPHNLNRTLFKLKHVGIAKVLALSELIYERRNDIQVFPIQKKLEDLNEFEMQMLKDCEVVIDCRDTTNPPLPSDLAKKQLITAGYDGFSVTIHINPKYNSVWGEEQVTYTITPSFLVPPQFLASLITLYICCSEIHREHEKISTFDIRKVFDFLNL